MIYKTSYEPKPLPEVELPELRQVGKPLRRIDALGKTTGTTVYAGDYVMPNMLAAKVFRSKEPSARIKRLDVSRAEALDGVVCVLTGDDLPGTGLATDMPGQTGTEERKGTRAPVLASDRVRFYGEPIALVAAETDEIAERALQLIDIEYELLPGVFDPVEALKPDAPTVYASGAEEPDNVVSRWRIRKGDVEAGFAAADEIVENTFRMPFVEHAYLEPEGGVSWVDDQGVINIRVSTQVVEHFRKVADAVGVAQNKIRTRGAMVGGGFGGKEDITVEIFLALLAKHTRRPVRLVYTREESFIAQSKRHPFIITHRTGVKRSGRITAAEIEMIADAGAYPYLSPYVLLYATIMSTGPYRIDNLRVDSVAAATNQPFTSAMRGFGGPQAAVAYEQQMDAIAEALGLDPLEVRRVNYLKTGEPNATGQTIDSAAWLEETATHALAALGEKGRPVVPVVSGAEPSEVEPAGGAIKVGRGVASTFQSYGRITWFHDTAQAWVGVEMDGAVVVRCGVPDHGGGQVNSLAQIAAELLGVPLDEVTVYSTDSAVTPLAGTTTATRQLYMSGSAVHKAATAVRQVLLDRASKHFEEPVENLDLAGCRVFVKAEPENAMALKELVARCASEGLPLSNLALFTAPFTDGIDPDTGQGDVFPDFTFGAQAVEVAVDTETGEVTVLKSAAAHDVGRAINPAAVQGQIQGGAAQGMGYALLEDFVVEQGVTKTPSLSEYLIPTAKDFPDTEPIIMESGTGVGPFGAKGIGEPALTPAAPAVANAVADAIGVRVHALPITPERVLEALACGEQGRTNRSKGQK